MNTGLRLSECSQVWLCRALWEQEGGGWSSLAFCLKCPVLVKRGWLLSTFCGAPKKHTKSIKSAACGGFKRGTIIFKIESLLTEGHIPRKMVKRHKTSQLSRIADEESPTWLNKQTQIRLTFIVRRSVFSPRGFYANLKNFGKMLGAISLFMHWKQ